MIEYNVDKSLCFSSHIILAAKDTKCKSCYAASSDAENCRKLTNVLNIAANNYGNRMLWSVTWLITSVKTSKFCFAGCNPYYTYLRCFKVVMLTCKLNCFAHDKEGTCERVHTGAETVS